jgi:predicted nucleotidyltransferase
MPTLAELLNNIFLSNKNKWYGKSFTYFINPYFRLNMMTDYQTYIPVLTQLLQQIDPFRVYLFGSVASGNATEKSDLDIAVILNSDKIHTTYDEKLETRVKVRETILELSSQISIDLVVYSKAEFIKLKEINSLFVREIEEKGKIIYEKNNP